MKYVLVKILAIAIGVCETASQNWNAILVWGTKFKGTICLKTFVLSLREEKYSYIGFPSSTAKLARITKRHPVCEDYS